jgi:hypothetical protein
MKAYIWLGILILSVFVAGVLLCRNFGVTPPSAHASEEISHSACDHDDHAVHRT